MKTSTHRLRSSSRRMTQPITHQWSGKLERTGSADQTSQRCTRCGQFAVNSGEFCVAPTPDVGKGIPNDRNQAEIDG